MTPLNHRDATASRAIPAPVPVSASISAAFAAALISIVIAALAGVCSPAERAYAADNTLETVYGVTRDEIVTWLESHEKDTYYLTTPYKPYDWRSPNGDINGWGRHSDGVSAGMNCTGFVWHALCAAHGWRDNITDVFPSLANWQTTIADKNLKTYAFDTKEEMLSSGKLKKGDVIWMWDEGKPNKISDVHHIAIFWGDSSSEDKMWHSSGDINNNWAGQNEISEIHGKAASVTYEIVKVSEEGGLKLTKASANPDITDGNTRYSVKGAVYGVFKTKAAAQTHDADKAIKTYKTNAGGAIDTGMAFKPGTYYVAETKPSKGYALDESTYKVTVEAYKTTEVNGGTVSEPVSLGALALKKVSARPEVTDGNAHFKLEGAMYGVFETSADAKTHNAGKAIETYTTDSAGSFTTEMDLPIGTYYVAETQASQGYELDDTVYKVSVKADETAQVNGGTVPEEPKRGGISLLKRSSHDSISSGNGCYTLDGALYGVFSSEASAKSHDGSQALKSYYTDGTGAFQSELEWDAGTYYISEIVPSAGYARDAAVYEIEVLPGEVTAVSSTGFVQEAPKHNPVTLWAAKKDAQTPDGGPEGTASLQAAEFEIRYYDGYYDIGSLPTRAKRTWIVRSDADGKAYVREDLKVSGDAFYYSPSGQVTLPLGTVTVRESKAPWGYHIGNGSDAAGGPQLIQIRSSDYGETVGAYTAPTFSDFVKRGGVAVGKVDRQNGKYLPQGGATLEGATFHIVTDNDKQVIVGGTRYTKGNVVASIKTAREADGRFIARTPADLLPVGRYTIREVASTEGYLYDSASRQWSRSFEISENGQVCDVTNTAIAVSNLVIRGDLAFSKADGQTGARLGLVPFLVTSETTGERHVLVTDENGMLSTATSWNAHSTRTNANDAALREGADGLSVEDAALDVGAGVWFHGRADAECPVDDALGALPYDSYEFRELPAKNNDGYEMATFTVRISRNAYAIDLGTVDDNAGPLIATSLHDDGGARLVPAGSDVMLIDTVDYANLDPRKTYTLKGSLHAVNDSLEDGGIIAENETEFQPRTGNGSVDVEFALDAQDVTCNRIVAFERLVDDAGTTIATHEELLYEGQTVRVPAIGTTLENAVGRGDSGADEDDDGKEGDNEAASSGGSEEGDDDEGGGGADDGQDGNREDDGESDDGESSSDKEDRQEDDGSASQQDGEQENDEDNQQDDEAPESEGEPDDVEAHTADASDVVTLLDTVAYSGLTPGSSYLMTGTLHVRDEDGADGGVALDGDGNQITSVTHFIAREPDGSVKVAFTFHAPSLAGQTVVAFEELSRSGKAYAVHADIEDDGQAVALLPPVEPPKEEEPPADTPSDEKPPAEAPPEAAPPSEAPTESSEAPTPVSTPPAAAEPEPTPLAKPKATKEKDAPKDVEPQESMPEEAPHPVPEKPVASTFPKTGDAIGFGIAVCILAAAAAAVCAMVTGTSEKHQRAGAANRGKPHLRRR